jgi:hypothetical protein
MNREYTVEEFRRTADTLLNLVTHMELATVGLLLPPPQTQLQISRHMSQMTYVTCAQALLHRIFAVCDTFDDCSVMASDVICLACVVKSSLRLLI